MRKPRNVEINKESYLELLDKLDASCRETTIKKNNDYAGKDAADVFKNFKVGEVMGLNTVEGFLTRMLDKQTRIKNLLSQENAVKDESILDTAIDLVNYAKLLAIYINTHLTISRLDDGESS